MTGYLALVLHAHLPFVRHPEHERSLEEQWLFEAMTESYIPLLQLLERWEGEGVNGQLTLTLSPSLCEMLWDPLLQQRYRRYLAELSELSYKELLRTHFQQEFNQVASFYQDRFHRIAETYHAYGGDIVAAFRRFQERGQIEIIACAATHAFLPLMVSHPPSLRAQVQIGCDIYRHYFGRAPAGFWLPECGYTLEVEDVLAEAGVKWFILESHGLLWARPRPAYGTLAPIRTPTGLAAFGRDIDSARQVWSREEGYPGDGRYRDFYRDIGFELDYDYVRGYLPAPPHRSFTGIKYYRVTGGDDEKLPYNRELALDAVKEHARHFVESRMSQAADSQDLMNQPPILLCPYDAELFGHWWYEGPEFLNCVVERVVRGERLRLITPTGYLERYQAYCQTAQPPPSSWGEEGSWKTWLTPSNEWIYRHLHVAQERMTQLVRRFSNASELQRRAVRQAGRELLLAQASDWPFILRTSTTPTYANQRLRDHLVRFNELYQQLMGDRLDPEWLATVEGKDNLFAELDDSAFGD